MQDVALSLLCHKSVYVAPCETLAELTAEVERRESCQLALCMQLLLAWPAQSYVPLVEFPELHMLSSQQMNGRLGCGPDYQYVRVCVHAASC